MQQFLWYDFETFGRDHALDRPSQFACLRTDDQLREIGEPLVLYCRPSPDYLPDPIACQITGITPAETLDKGLSELEFAKQLNAQFDRGNTCGVGYNSIRFDDEFFRHLLYRNFIDPYGREWRDGNSRWDLIDLVRSCWALRPEGIQWPEIDGTVSLKLEHLSAANGIEHSDAHDALSDVRATIALARLLRAAQPRLFDYALSLRNKATVLDKLDCETSPALVHVSGNIARAHGHHSVVMPLLRHPRVAAQTIVCDLRIDPETWLNRDAETLRAQLYTPQAALGDTLRPPLKTIYANRSPIIAPLGVLDANARQRWGHDLEACERHRQVLLAHRPALRDTLRAVYSDAPPPPQDAEQALYAGFPTRADQALLRQGPDALLERAHVAFADSRYQALHQRFRARNAFAHCSAAEQQAWLQFCLARLRGEGVRSARSFAEFDQHLRALPPQDPVVAALRDYRQQLEASLCA